MTINRNKFMDVLKERGISIRQLDDPQDKKGIGRTEKTIRRALEAGKMSEELLDNIACYLDVDPNYLSGLYDEQANLVENEIIRKLYKKRLTLDKYPYLLKARSDIKYPIYFENILTMNFFTMKQFKELDQNERVLFHQELIVAIYQVLANHFEYDALGNSTKEELAYLEDFVDDFDPFSYFAELEGVSISENTCAMKNPVSESDLKKEALLEKKYNLT